MIIKSINKKALRSVPDILLTLKMLAIIITYISDCFQTF